MYSHPLSKINIHANFHVRRQKYAYSHSVRVCLTCETECVCEWTCGLCLRETAQKNKTKMFLVFLCGWVGVCPFGLIFLTPPSLPLFIQFPQ